MQKTFVTLAALSALTLGACTHEESVLNKPPGTYENKTISTDANGTTTERKSSTDVSEDAYGHKRAVVKSKTTKDPEGLFNKTTTSQSKEVIQDSNY